MFTGKKPTAATWSAHPNFTAMGSPGNSAFMTMSATSTGASSRTSFGQGVGLYNGFFDKRGITKVAYVDGSSLSTDPFSHSNYLVYDLVESTSTESMCDILKRLDIYQRDAASFHGNDLVWPLPSVVNHTAGPSGWSGLLVATGGTGFRTSSPAPLDWPDKFCVMGINRDSDNDIQALCAYSGNLSTGKGDTWRGQNPPHTFWSYWGDDFHTDSKLRRIGQQLQSPPGVPTTAPWNGDVYLLAYTP